MERDVRRSGLDAHAALGHQRLGSPDGDGYARCASRHGKIKRTLLEGQQAAVFGAGSFDKGGDVDAFRENAACLFNTALRTFFATISIHGNKFSKLKTPAEDRNAHQRAFEKCGGAARDGRQ